MTIDNVTKWHVNITTEAANETIDTEFYHEDCGQVKLVPSYFEGTGGLEVSGDGVTWIALAQSVNTLIPNDVNYPKYIRAVNSGVTIYFNTSAPTV